MRTYSYPDTVYFEHMVILSGVAEATSAPTTHTEARLAGHRSHRNRLVDVNWHRRSKSTGDAEVHFAETEPHRAWLRATLRREVYFGEAEPEEPTPQKPTPNLTRQMTVKAKAFLEAQDKRKEWEDGEKAKALARHEAWVDGQIKRNSSEPKEAVRKLWREEQHARGACAGNGGFARRVAPRASHLADHQEAGSCRPSVAVRSGGSSAHEELRGFSLPRVDCRRTLARPRCAAKGLGAARGAAKKNGLKSRVYLRRKHGLTFDQALPSELRHSLCISPFDLGHVAERQRCPVRIPDQVDRWVRSLVHAVVWQRGATVRMVKPIDWHKLLLRAALQALVEADQHLAHAEGVHVATVNNCGGSSACALATDEAPVGKHHTAHTDPIWKATPAQEVGMEGYESKTFVAHRKLSHPAFEGLKLQPACHVRAHDQRTAQRGDTRARQDLSFRSNQTRGISRRHPRARHVPKPSLKVRLASPRAETQAYRNVDSPRLHLSSILRIGRRSRCSGSCSCGDATTAWAT